MVHLTITAENFSAIRENLKSGVCVVANEVITLTSYIANTEKVNENGKTTRTPFYYISENGKRFTSTTLKEALGIEPETKGKREETTFAKVWEQAKGLAKAASSEELKEAAKYLQELAKAKAKEEAEAKANKIAELEAQLKALKGK